MQILQLFATLVSSRSTFLFYFFTFGKTNQPPVTKVKLALQ